MSEVLYSGGLTNLGTPAEQAKANADQVFYDLENRKAEVARQIKYKPEQTGLSGMVGSIRTRLSKAFASVTDSPKLGRGVAYRSDPSNPYAGSMSIHQADPRPTQPESQAYGTLNRAARDVSEHYWLSERLNAADAQQQAAFAQTERRLATIQERLATKSSNAMVHWLAKTPFGQQLVDFFSPTKTSELLAAALPAREKRLPDTDRAVRAASAIERITELARRQEAFTNEPVARQKAKLEEQLRSYPPLRDHAIANGYVDVGTAALNDEQYRALLADAKVRQYLVFKFRGERFVPPFEMTGGLEAAKVRLMTETLAEFARLPNVPGLPSAQLKYNYSNEVLRLGDYVRPEPVQWSPYD